jgi:RNA polymerase sigma factor (TIGR02999 family)
MSDVTRILAQIQQGDPAAADHLLPLVYDELRRLAAQKLAREKPGQTLDATALVHEAYLRLVKVGAGSGAPDGDRDWDNARHFFAAEAMRRILVETRAASGTAAAAAASTPTWPPSSPANRTSNSSPCTTPWSGSRPGSRLRRNSSSCASSLA